MSNKVIRDIPDSVMRDLEMLRVLHGKRSAEEWIRDLLGDMTKVRSDESTFDYILLEIERINAAISAIQSQFQPWVEQGKNIERVKSEIAQPVQCLTMLLYIKSNLIQICDLFNNINSTLKDQQNL